MNLTDEAVEAICHYVVQTGFGKVTVLRRKNGVEIIQEKRERQPIGALREALVHNGDARKITLVQSAEKKMVDIITERSYKFGDTALDKNLSLF
jgi:hypothetical protein